VKPLPKELRYYDKVLSIPNGASLLRSVNVKNKLEVNSAVELYFQFEQQLRGREAIRLGAVTDLFGDLIDEPLFDQLRTKEQLGYTVNCGPRLTTDVLGFCFTIQSSEYNPFYLQNRIDSFIDGLQKLLAGIDDGAFDHHRSGLIANKLEKAPSLLHEADIYWNEIAKQRYNYGIAQAEAEELKTIQKRDVIDLYNTYIKPKSHKCRQLAIHVWGCNTDVADVAKMQQGSWKVIDDIDSLKRSSEFYSCLC
jgi:nardilysin